MSCLRRNSLLMALALAQQQASHHDSQKEAVRSEKIIAVPQRLHV
jgi:hypothetical protein